MILGGDGASMGQVVEEGVSGPTDGDALVEISVSGVMISDGDSLNSEGITHSLLKMLAHARKDSKVKGVLIRLNTPGGGVTDADLVYHEIERVKKAGKKVMILMGDLCASGGFYASLAADESWALPTTLTGSIGVIIQILNFSELLTRYGVQDLSVTSGPNKALLSSTQAPKKEHQEILQSIVSEMYERFVDLLKKGRKLDDEKARTLADGRIYTANQALKSKLIDKIGYREDALKRLGAMVNAKNPPKRLIRYRIPVTFFSQFALQLSAYLNPFSSIHLATHPHQAYYMYAPNGFAPLFVKGLP
jgi:protease-4